MNFTKKFDRAFQWAGEKMGGEAKTSHSDEFRMMETEMALRFDGMEKLHKSMNTYVKWISRRGETFEDKEKGVPLSYLARTMVSHGEDFESDSEFGNCLVSMGRVNERLAGIQEQFAADATTTWLESIERSLAMMKEYQASRKKLESRRLAYDANLSKMQKARREDFRIEEELRMSKAKFEESSEDVIRRMQDIKDTEPDSIRDLTRFLDAELDFHERCADELRRARRAWVASGPCEAPDRRTASRSRSNTTHSLSERSSRSHVLEEERDSQPARPSIRSNGRISSLPDSPVRPTAGRATTFQGPMTLERRSSGQLPNVGALRGQLKPVNRINTEYHRDDVFADRDDDTASGSGSPGWGDRSASPATSFGSLSLNRSTGGLAKKVPPPPPPSRSKKPAPPIPAKRAEVDYY